MQLPRSLLAIVLLLLLPVVLVHSRSTMEPCDGFETCTSLLAYNLPTDMKLSEIATQFQVDVLSLLGANALDISENQIMGANYAIKVPMACQCAGGIRKSAPTIYRVKPGETISTIADGVFSKLVTPGQIQYANSLPGSDLVEIGQLLVIPLPCACFSGMDNGQPAIYLSYVAQDGDSLFGIAMEHGTTVSDLIRVNSLASRAIAPGDILDVPLAGCLSRPPAIIVYKFFRI